MDIIFNFIKETSSVIVAGGVICGLALKIGRGVLKKELKPFNDKISKMEKARIEQHEETKREINVLKDELTKNSLNTMKNTICNSNIPLSERISVGKEYVAKGGNGAVKVYLHKLETEYERGLQGGDKL